MKHAGIMRQLGLLFIVTLVMTSCTPSATHELTVDVNMAELIQNRVKDSKDSDYTKVLQATFESQRDSKSNFIETFFKKSDELFPDKLYVTYFKTRSGLHANMSNKEVKDFFKSKREQVANQVIEILSKRLDECGIASAEFLSKSDQVKIGLAESRKEVYLARKVMMTADLQFLEVYDYKQIKDVWYQAYLEFNRNDAMKYGASGKAEVFGDHLFVSTINKREIGEFLKSETLKSSLPADLKFMWSESLVDKRDGSPKGYVLYACKIPKRGDVQLNENDIESAEAGLDQVEGKVTVNIEMSSKGAKDWHKITLKNVGRTIAMTMNGEVFSAPQVASPISGGTTQISGSFTESEAEEIALILNVGNLPVGCQFKHLKKL